MNDLSMPPIASSIVIGILNRGRPFVKESRRRSFRVDQDDIIGHMLGEDDGWISPVLAVRLFENLMEELFEYPVPINDTLDVETVESAFKRLRPKGAHGFSHCEDRVSQAFFSSVVDFYAFRDYFTRSSRA